METICIYKTSCDTNKNTMNVSLARSSLFFDIDIQNFSIWVYHHETTCCVCSWPLFDIDLYVGDGGIHSEFCSLFCRLNWSLLFKAPVFMFDCKCSWEFFLDFFGEKSYFENVTIMTTTIKMSRCFPLCPYSDISIAPLLMCSECVSLSVNFYRKSEGVRIRGHETSSSAQRDVPEFL